MFRQHYILRHRFGMPSLSLCLKVPIVDVMCCCLITSLPPLLPFSCALLASEYGCAKRIVPEDDHSYSFLLDVCEEN
jgi:hypothetical protein